jgi:large subunit ribosomal protein L29
MRSSELRNLTLVELQERLTQTMLNLYQLRVRATTKELENTAQIPAERRNIARIKQAIAEKMRETPAAQPGADKTGAQVK